MKKNVAISIAAVLLVLLLFVLASNGKKPYERSEYVLDTVVTVKVLDARPSTPEDVSGLFDMLRDFERRVDYFDPDSDISVLNTALTNGGRVEMEGELGDLIELSLKLARETGGAFDPTIGRLMDIWQFDRGGRVPGKSEIKMALAYCGYRKLKVKNGTVTASTGIKIDPGGISKGFAVDLCSEYLRSRGYRNFLINTVSSTAASGSKEGEPFTVGIENPDGEGLLAVIKLKDGETASTSGDYQRYFEKNGKRYHHILNPRTGYPAETFHVVTVVTTESAAAADAYSTAVFVMGERKGIRFAQKKGLKLFAVTVDGRTIIYPEGGWIELKAH